MIILTLNESKDHCFLQNYKKKDHNYKNTHEIFNKIDKSQNPICKFL